MFRRVVSRVQETIGTTPDRVRLFSELVKI